jgi:hypothetical protein
LDPGLTTDPPLRDALHSFPEYGSFFFPAFMDNPLIVLDPIDYGIVRLLSHHYVGEVVTLLDRRIIVDHRVIDDRGRTVVVDNGSTVNVGHPGIPVIVHIVEIVLVDHDGMVYVSIILDVNVDLGDVDVVHDDHTRATPRPVAVIRLVWSEGHPSYVRPGVNPENPSGIPVKAHIEQRHADAHTCHRWGPVPIVPHVDPVAVVVGDVTEGFCRNPRLVPIPVGPAAYGEWRPSQIHSGRPPEPALRTGIVDSLPRSIFVKGI